MIRERTGPDAYGEDYYRLYSGRKPQFYSGLLGDVIKNGLPGSILDLGCGLGLFVELAATWDLEISGLDGSEAAIRIALERTPGLNLHVHDLSEPLPFAADAVNNIVLFQVISNILPKFRRNLIVEVRRVLRTGGVVFVYSPSKRNRRVRERDPTICYAMYPSELRALLLDAGFRILAEPNEGPRMRIPLLGRIVNVLTNSLATDLLSETANVFAVK